MSHETCSDLEFARTFLLVMRGVLAVPGLGANMRIATSNTVVALEAAVRDPRAAVLQRIRRDLWPIVRERCGWSSESPFDVVH